MISEVEMHAHSFYSDGYDSPGDVVKEAKKKGLKAVCLTDHDDYQGLPEFLEATKKFGIDTLNGIEITTTYKDAVDVHILGYGIDLSKKDILNKGLANNWKMHNERARIILQKYADAGVMNATIEDIRQVIDCKNDYPYVSRGHIKKYRFLNFGVSYEESDNETRRGVGVAGMGYIRELLISPKEAMELIQKVGGKAVLAHPGNYLKKLEKDEALSIDIFYEILDILTEAGLFGLEVNYINHTDEERKLFTKLAKERDLFITAASDYHGAYDLRRPLGKEGITYKNFLKFKEACLSK